MSDTPQLPNNDSIKSDRSLQQLAWAIAASAGQFKLILARCNYASWRDRLISQLREISPVDIRVLVVQSSQRTLYTAIGETFGAEIPGCVMVVGLETVQNLAVMLTSANQVREEFRQHFPFPVVLWIDDGIYKQLMEVAPDLESWAITRNFPISQPELTDFISETANQWFSNSLKLSAEACIKLEHELETAQRDLLNYTAEFSTTENLSPNLSPTRGEALNSPPSLVGKGVRGLGEGLIPHSASQNYPNGSNLELTANLESLLGFAKQINNQTNSAIEHYRQALALWQQSKNLERQAKIISEIAFCYYTKACQQQDDNSSYWQATRQYAQEYIQIITQLQYPDFLASSIFKIGDVLCNLQAWEPLKNLVEQALTIHQTNQQPRELAKDYSFLAEVALAQGNWQEANQLIKQALDTFATIPKSTSVNISGIVADIPDKLLQANDLSFQDRQARRCKAPRPLASDT